MWHKVKKTDVPDEGKVKEILEEYRKAEFPDLEESGSDTDVLSSEEESGSEDGDVIDKNESDIEETVESVVRISENDYEKYLKYLCKNESISNLLETAEELGMTKDKLKTIIRTEDDLEEKYPETKEKIERKGKGKGRAPLKRKQGRKLDM